MNALVLTTFLEVCVFLLLAGILVLAFAVFIWVFADIFRRDDMSGLAKAGWILLVFILPVVGSLFYIGTRPNVGDSDPVISWAPAAGEMTPAEEIAYAQTLLENGTITQAEFDDIKRRTI